MLSNKEWLLIADGEPLAKEEVLRLAKNKAVMVLDGAYTQTLADYLQPQVVMGDLDSMEPRLKENLEQNKEIPLIQETDQNTTDLEKGLLYLSREGASSVTIVNATGWRLDHTLYNLGLLKRFHQTFESLRLVTARELIFYLEDQNLSLEAEQPEAIALLGFPEAVVTSSGLLYELQKLCLQQGAQESISNAMRLKSAKLEIEGGVLLLVGHRTRIILNPSSPKNNQVNLYRF